MYKAFRNRRKQVEIAPQEPVAQKSKRAAGNKIEWYSPPQICTTALCNTSILKFLGGTEFICGLYLVLIGHFKGQMAFYKSEL